MYYVYFRYNILHLINKYFWLFICGNVHNIINSLCKNVLKIATP
jgi:hypothetical protein